MRYRYSIAAFRFLACWLALFSPSAFSGQPVPYQRVIIDAELYHTCANTDDGLRCWGQPEMETVGRDEFDLDHFLLSSVREADFYPAYGAIQLPAFRGKIVTYDTGDMQGCAIVRQEDGKKVIQCWRMRNALNKILYKTSSLSYGNGDRETTFLMHQPTQAEITFVPYTFADPREISVRDTQVCVNDTKAGVVCWLYGHQKYTHKVIERTICEKLPTNSNGCRSDKTAVVNYYTPQPNSNPSIPGLHHLTAGYQGWCGIDSNERIRCRAHSGGDSLISVAAVPRPVALRFIAKDSIDEYRGEVFCAIGREGQEACFSTDSGTPIDAKALHLSTRSEHRFTRGEVASDNAFYGCLAADGKMSCVASGQAMLKDGQWSQRPAVPVVPPDLRFFHIPEVSPLAALSERLATIGPGLYAPKDRFLARVVRVLEQSDPVSEAGREIRLFAFNLAKVFLEQVSSQYVQTEVLPEFRAKLEYYNELSGIQALGDLKLTPQTRDLSLVAIGGALTEAKAYAITDASKQAIEQLLPVVAEALASGDDRAVSSAIRDLASRRSLFAELAATKDTQAFGIVLGVLVDYLALQLDAET